MILNSTKDYDLQLYLNLFRDMFKLEEYSILAFWWKDPKTYKDDDEARILALLLAYEIAKRGDF